MNGEYVPKEDISDIPIGMSAGGDNATYVFCDEISGGQKKAYAACLHIAARLKDGSFEGDETYLECERAIKNDRCRSMKMRAEELEAGKALYYESRPEIIIEPSKVDKTSLGYALGWNKYAGKLSNLPAPERKIPSPSAVTTTQARKSSKSKSTEKSTETPSKSIYGDVVEQLAKEERVQAEKQAQQSTVSPAKRGISLLDIARGGRK